MPLFCFADSISGGRPQVPGRGQYYAVPLIGAYLWIFFGAHLDLLHGIGAAVSAAVAYALWRGEGWHLKWFGGLFNGSINPIGPAETWHTFARHCLALTLMVPVWLLGGDPLMLLAFPPIATALGVYNAKTEAKHNSAVEDVRGFALGFLMFVALLGAVQ